MLADGDIDGMREGDSEGISLNVGDWDGTALKLGDPEGALLTEGMALPVGA